MPRVDTGGMQTATSETAAREKAGMESTRMESSCGSMNMLPIEDFLAVVGARVRRRRSMVHLSRRGLAERSGVSERYLAQLETGQGNMSIALLRKVAGALQLPLPELVAEDDIEGTTARLVAGGETPRADFR